MSECKSINLPDETLNILTLPPSPELEINCDITNPDDSATTSENETLSQIDTIRTFDNNLTKSITVLLMIKLYIFIILRILNFQVLLIILNIKLTPYSLKPEYLKHGKLT
jgi:hypothetical protein